MPPSFSRIVDEVAELDQESKQELLNLLRAWLTEERREEILRNARQAEQEYAAGKCRSGSVDDLAADLYAED